QVELRQAAAHELGAIQPAGFDVVVLNSVAQYFPDVRYLMNVLRLALGALAPGGAVFVGDVRSLPLLEAFATSVELAQAPDVLDVRDVPNARVARELDALARLAQKPRPATVADLRASLAWEGAAGVDPEALWTLAPDYDVAITWSASGPRAFDARFRRRDAGP